MAPEEPRGMTDADERAPAEVNLLDDSPWSLRYADEAEGLDLDGDDAADAWKLQGVTRDASRFVLAPGPAAQPYVAVSRGRDFTTHELAEADWDEPEDHVIPPAIHLRDCNEFVDEDGA